MRTAEIAPIVISVATIRGNPPRQRFRLAKLFLLFRHHRQTRSRDFHAKFSLQSLRSCALSFKSAAKSAKHNFRADSTGFSFRFSWKHVRACGVGEVCRGQTLVNRIRSRRHYSNSPFDAPVAFGAAVERFELTLDREFLADAFLGELHEAGALRARECVICAIIESARELRAHKNQQQR